jgi:hypothetical protein
MGAFDADEQGNATSATGERGAQQELAALNPHAVQVPDYCPSAGLRSSTANRYPVLSVSAKVAARRSYRPGPGGELGRVVSGGGMHC